MGFAFWQRYCTASSSGHQPNFVALNRGRRLCSAGRPSRWALAHILVENFLKFSKRRRAVPLWPIWTIMVAAKLDQSRVLVTNFHQNRSTMKGRMPVRHTHTQTDRQTYRQTRLKIMAFQVCNRANILIAILCTLAGVK